MLQQADSKVRMPTVLVPRSYAAAVPLPGTSAIENAAREQLRRCGYPSLGSIVCQQDRGILTLRGRVGSYYLKQLAQEFVRHVSGVERVRNQIVVD